MLVLSRKAGQKIHIGDDIVVEVRRIAGNRITLALDAPRDVRILRGELHESATDFEMETADSHDEPNRHVPDTLTAHFESMVGHASQTGVAG